MAEMIGVFIGEPLVSVCAGWRWTDLAALSDVTVCAAEDEDVVLEPFQPEISTARSFLVTSRHLLARPAPKQR